MSAGLWQIDTGSGRDSVWLTRWEDKWWSHRRPTVGGSGPGPLPVVSVTPESADTTSHTVKYSPNCSHEDIHLSVRLLIRPLCPVPVHSPRRSRLLRDLTMTSSSSLNFVPPTNDTFLAFSSVDFSSILQLTILHFLLPRNDVYDFSCPPIISTTFIFLLRITLQLLLSSPRTKLPNISTLYPLQW